VKQTLCRISVCVCVSLDPVLVHVPGSSEVRMSCVRFALNSESILAGDSDGQLSVYQLCGMTAAAPADSQVHVPPHSSIHTLRAE